MTMSPITYDEMRPGCYEPKARVDDMELNWVEASLSFPSFPRFCGQTFLEAKDRELAEACVYAYNDWMVDEWCGDSGGRLIPLPIIPLWDAELAAAEVRRNAARGVRAVCFSEIPPHLGLPSIHSGYWDPFFAACAETRHGRVHAHRVVVEDAGDVRRRAGRGAATLSFGNAMSSLTDFLFSGVLVRFPDLKLAYSEGQIGWIPYILERADDVWLEHRAWGGVRDIVPEPPSTYYYRQVFGCFFRDRHGIESLQTRRRRQHDLRDRLPAHRLHLAAHEEGGAGVDGRAPRRRRAQARARQRHPHARARPLSTTRHYRARGSRQLPGPGGLRRRRRTRRAPRARVPERLARVAERGRHPVRRRHARAAHRRRSPGRARGRRPSPPSRWPKPASSCTTAPSSTRPVVEMSTPRRTSRSTRPT